MNDVEIRRRLYLVLPPHQTWCQAIGHFDCCGKTDEDCDCGVIESLNELLPVVRAITAEELRAAAEGLRSYFTDSDGWLCGNALVAVNSLTFRADDACDRADALDPS